MPSPTSELSPLIANSHVQLQSLFICHQEALLLNEFVLATDLFQAFLALHQLHLGFEDQHLLPCLQASDINSQWQPRVYSLEHRKIESLLLQLHAELKQLIAATDVDSSRWRRSLLQLISHQRRVNSVCEHHEAREEADLLPLLDRHLGADELQKLSEQFSSAWSSCLDRHQQLMQCAQQVLGVDVLTF